MRLTTTLLFALACSGGEAEPGETGEPLSVLATFDPAVGELPEGVAVLGDRAYVGFATLGEIRAVPLDGSGAPEPYATVPPLPPDAAFLTGLTFDDRGRLYAAVGSFSADLAGGLYRASEEGGDAVAFGTTIPFANDSAFASDGTLFATDSTGAVDVVTPDGTVIPWSTDPLLAGDRTICGRDDASFDVGANGLAVTDEALYVANSDRATLVRIPRAADGSAGEATVLAGPDCELLGGIDGLALDSRDGSLYAALNYQDRVVRVSADGSVSTLIDDPVLDFPASLRLLELEDRPALLVTNFALDAALSGGAPEPSLIRWWLD
jgi:sugar lactone lactonase YvrE